jgi:ABC-2 type transport system permease protein
MTVFSETRTSGAAPGEGFGAPVGRILGILLRHLYLLRNSWPRVLDLVYWPTLQMIIWGFTSQFMRGQSGYVAAAFGVLLGAVLLWDVFFRSQLGLSMSFLEEIWARHLGHLFVAPLRPQEWMAALLIMSLIRVMIGMVPAALLAIPFFGYSVFDMGPPLIGFFFCLVLFGWAIGMAICAVILLYGLGAESLAWSAVFMLAPVSAIYYPVSVLPIWLQPVAWALPTAHIFEGMRRLLFTHTLDWAQLGVAAALDLVWILLGAGAFALGFRIARERGKLLGTGE